MKEFKNTVVLFCIMSILIGIIPIAMADQNSTNATNATNVTNETPTVTPTITPTATTQVVTTPSPTATEGKFRVGPVVRLRPLNDEINKSSDGLIELFMSNPTVNDITLHVDAYVSAPSGIHVYGTGFGQADAAGTVYGTFDVPPGTARTVYMNIKSEKVGDFFIQFSGMYYPGDNKDLYQPLSLTHPFKVTAPSQNPNDANPTNPTQVPSQESVGANIIGGYWWLIVLVLVVIIALVALGRGGGKSEVVVEQK